MVRLDGTNDEEGRELLAEADLPNVHTEATMLGAAKRVVELAGGGAAARPRARPRRSARGRRPRRRGRRGRRRAA